MKQRYALIIILILIPLLLVSLFLTFGVFDDSPLDFYLGVSAAFNNVEEVKALVDKAGPYINTIMLGSTGITHNFTKLDEVCQYIYDRGMYFMIYAHPVNDTDQLAIQRQWVLDATPRWGERFLGLYAYDEPGGRQLDNATLKAVKNEDWFADNCTEAADKYTNEMFLYLHHTIEDQMGGLALTLFTSDYALYWFDYKAHYDVVFAEFGWNYSRQLNVALCRGAANVQNKDWGVMITWTYIPESDDCDDRDTYIESASDLYNDLVLAYENGAKYILVFDTNKNYTHSTLLYNDGQVEALRDFRDYAVKNPRDRTLAPDRVAYVLPEGYGYGFRGPDDKIWGLWDADAFSLDISTQLGGFIDRYPNRLDIIYDDGLEANNSYGYSKLTFWNDTVWSP